jgi:hypothetical protein
VNTVSILVCYLRKNEGSSGSKQILKQLGQRGNTQPLAASLGLTPHHQLPVKEYPEMRFTALTTQKVPFVGTSFLTMISAFSLPAEILLHVKSWV